MKRALSIAFVFFIALHAPAQLAVGDLGITGFVFTPPQQFTVLHANGTSTVYPLAGLTPLMHAILYDPSQPGTFLVGGVGFLGRVTVSGATASYVPITGSVSTVSQMSFDGPDLVVFDSGTPGQVIKVNPVTGAITPVTTGTPPWGSDLNSGCRDPNTGDLYVGGNNAIWRIPAGTSTPVPFASGWTAGSSSVTGLAIDPVSLQVVATLLTVNRFVRIDAGGNLTNISPVGAVPGPNAVDVDENGNFVVAGSFGQTYRVPNAGGAPVLIGTASGFVGAATGVSTVIDAFAVTALPVGAGGLSISVAGIPPGTVEGFTVPSFDVALPVGQGPILGLSPDAFSIALVTAFPAASPGNVVHWSWPVSFPLYPAASFVAPPGTLASGTTLDVLVVAFNAGFVLTPAPVVRVTMN
jgi:hypothetical protein